MTTAISQSSRWTAIGALSAGIAVVCGAVGSHALRPYLTSESLRAWQIATDYQLAHGLALLLVSLLQQQNYDAYRRYRLVAWLFFIGTILFCGSLYGLAITRWSALGPITPIGGLCFITGWSLLSFRAWKTVGPTNAQSPKQTESEDELQ
jgi:uncharacterized membrane protein YgdD (TMEM256/DUF423 family)